MQYPATRLPKVGTTIFSQMSQLALTHKAINLSQGFPDYDGPKALLDSVGAYIEQGANQYAPMTGVAPLREAIAAKIQRCYGRSVDAGSEVTVTSGATEALFAAIASVVRTGDEVIVFDPAYDSYDPAVTLNGGVVHHLALTQPDFAIDWSLLEQTINANTRLIILNTPHNPSGTVLNAADMERLQTLLSDTSILLLSDEVYEHIIFDQQAHQSVNRYPQLAERAFIVSSFGKTYYITGWKVGYSLAPAVLTAELRKVHQYLTFSTTTPMQLALADYLTADPEHDQKLGTFYQQKRDLFNDLLKESRFKFTPAAGTYFQVMDYSAISDLPDVEFCQWLIEHAGVAAIPMSVFYEEGKQQSLIRFCFAKGEETLRNAAVRLKNL